MAKLIYIANVSLDGYIEDAHGGFEWTEPTDAGFTFITNLVRPVGTYLYGRRLYAAMAVWESDPTASSESRHQLRERCLTWHEISRGSRRRQNHQRVEPGVSSAVPTAVAVRGLTS